MLAPYKKRAEHSRSEREGKDSNIPFDVWNLIDDDKFKLSAVGVSSDKEYNYRTKQYVDLTSVGVGTQTFDYPPITVSVTGKVGIASTGLQTFECETQPIFRGEITSIHLSNQGVGYGSSEILNFVREPNVSIVSGEEAQLTPIVVDGAISEVVVLKVGKKYIKIGRKSDYDNRMGQVWAFVVNTDDDKLFQRGDILNAAGWNAPARNAPRGNVLDGGFKIDWTGPLYL